MSGLHPDIQAVLAGESEGCILCGDGPRMLVAGPVGRWADMVFADPPDNLGLRYEGYADRLPAAEYRMHLQQWLYDCRDTGKTIYFTPYFRHAMFLGALVDVQGLFSGFDVRQIIWRFTFGQHRATDLGNGYRPIFRIRQPGAPLYPDAIREPSARQTKYNDKRANPKGRVPDDVWEFPRVCGTFKEKRTWCPTQIPEALVERAILLSTKPGDVVADPFLGSGTTCIVAKRLGRRYVGIDVSPTYVEKAQAAVDATAQRTDQ